VFRAVISDRNFAVAMNHVISSSLMKSLPRPVRPYAGARPRRVAGEVVAARTAAGTSTGACMRKAPLDTMADSV
jgi:hypothetical protein